MLEANFIGRVAPNDDDDDDGGTERVEEDTQVRVRVLEFEWNWKGKWGKRKATGENWTYVSSSIVTCQLISLKTANQLPTGGFVSSKQMLQSAVELRTTMII